MVAAENGPDGVHPGGFSGDGLEERRIGGEAGSPAGKSPQLFRIFLNGAPTDRIAPWDPQLEMLKSHFACEASRQWTEGVQ